MQGDRQGRVAGTAAPSVTASPAYRLRLSGLTYPHTVTLSCSASATAISVGEVLDATSGTPMRAAFSSISDEIRPVESRIRSAVGMPHSKASPLSLSTAL